jgi:hypothetical protein
MSDDAITADGGLICRAINESGPMAAGCAEQRAREGTPRCVDLGCGRCWPTEGPETAWDGTPVPPDPADRCGFRGCFRPPHGRDHLHEDRHSRFTEPFPLPDNGFRPRRGVR